MFNSLYSAAKSLFRKPFYTLLILVLLSLTVFTSIKKINTFFYNKKNKQEKQDIESKLAQELVLEANKLAEDKNASTLQLALEDYEKALLHSRKAGNKSLEIEILIQETKIYLALEKNHKALEICQEITPFINNLDNPRLEAELLSNKGMAYCKLEQIDKGINCHKKALKIFESLNDSYKIAIAYNNLGEIYLTGGLVAEARKNYGKALTLFHSLYKQSSYTKEQIDLEVIQTFKNLGDAFGREKQAIFYFELALKLLNKSAKDDFQKAALLQDLSSAIVLVSDKNDLYLNSQKGINYLQQALALFKALGFTAYQSRTLTVIGQIYGQKLRNNSKALGYLYKALELSPENEDQNVTWQSDLLYEIAYDEFYLNKLENSKKYLEKYIQLSEKSWDNAVNQSLRGTYAFNTQYGYSLYVRTLMRLHKQDPKAGYDVKAFQISELGQSKNLLNLLVQANVDIKKGASKNLLELEIQLAQEISDKNRLYENASKDETKINLLKKLEKERDEAIFKHEEILADIKQESTQYTKIAQPNPLSLEEIQQLLDPDTLLLEYKLLEKDAYLWAVTKNSFKSYVLEKPEKITTVAKKLYHILSLPGEKKETTTGSKSVIRNLSPDEIASLEKDYLRTVPTLSKMVLGSVANEIKGKRLLIVSDGMLQYIPFVALPNPSLRKQNLKTPLLVESNEVINLPSISAISLLRKTVSERAVAPLTALVVADPVFGSDDIRTKQKENKEELAKLDIDVPSIVRDEKLGRLIFSNDEAIAITSDLPKKSYKLLLGFDSSRENILKENLKLYRYIHFATHSLLNVNLPQISGLVLSCVDQKGNPQNGFLTLLEIYNLKLSADLVVLSACQTGLGKVFWGEGFASLTRGFMYAGTPRVVSSLWKVDDNATSKLMEIFYREMIKENKSPAKALRIAQLEMYKNEKFHYPFFWAGFVLQGEWR